MSVWLAILLILLVYCLALGGSLVVRRKWWSGSQNHTTATITQLSDEDLRERCCKLSGEIREFYTRQQEDFDKRMRSDFRTVFLQEEPHQSQWRAEERERHENMMVDRYSEQLGAVVSTLCDDLELRGWCTLQDRNRFENPTGPQDIRYTAQRLAAICNGPDSGSQEYHERISSTEKRQAATTRRKDVKDLLGEARKEGQSLRSSYKQERHEKADAAKDWVRRTHDLIEAAFEKGEAQFFLVDELDKGLDPVDACLRRLDQLIVRANSLNVNPDFDTQAWTNHT